MRLRLGHDLAPSALAPSLAHGPGRRVALFVQGCRLRCTEVCLSPHLLDPAAGVEVATDAVVDAVRAVARRSPAPVAGVTVLGGEPTEQAAALARVLAPLRAEGLTAWVYSGRALAELEAARDPAVAALLGETDVLVDGPFLPARYREDLAWRGSANQELRCLSGRETLASIAAAWARQRKAFSIRGDAAGRLAVTGLQTRGGAAAIERLLEV